MGVSAGVPAADGGAGAAGARLRSRRQEFEPTAQSGWNRVRQADRDEGRRHDGPTGIEREELTQAPA
jgi:transposase